MALEDSPMEDVVRQPKHEDGGVKDDGSRIEELKSWLRGHISKPDFFTTQPPYDLEDLHMALYLAVIEIVQRLDPELEATIHMASDQEYNISLNEDAFFDYRRIDADGLRDSGLEGVKMQSRGRTIMLLELAKDEIEWLENETRRLEVHCRNARELLQMKLRTSFEYRPSPRKKRYQNRPSNFETPAPTPVVRKTVVKEENHGDMDDEEMLDIAETVERVDSRDTRAQSWGSVNSKQNPDKSTK